MTPEKRLYIDINVIQTVPPSCVNRDDTGSPKTCIYGGVRRARVSSQSWKKATRDYFHTKFDQENLAIRTKKVVDLIAERITELDPSKEGEAVRMATDILGAAGVKVGAKKTKKKDEEGSPETGALFFIGTFQVDKLAKLALEGCGDKKTAKEALNSDMAVEIALFGRMVADDPSLNSDASVQVAHAISTHRVENEYDYYTAMDERSPEDNAGAGMIGTVEFNSSTLYRYSTIAVHDLESILGSREATVQAVREYIEAFILSMPTGKQNTFANRTVPQAVYIVAREDQPVNLVPAFESPVRSSKDDGGYSVSSIGRLVRYQEEITGSFVRGPVASWQVGSGLGSLGPVTDLKTAIESVSAFILEN